MRDHYELFGLVYGFAGNLAIARSSSGLVARLTEVYAACDDTDDPVEFGTYASTFQATVVDAAQSPKVKVLLRAMSALVPGDFFVLVPDAMVVWRKSFSAVLRAFRRGDGDAVAAEFLRAMRKIGEKVVGVFEERGLFEPAASA
ncbi:MAG: FCD domain-containing protein [Acidimicrobiia bacterium]|nr:FCD domain-containing protein [Acidimicrobiia bacterium]